MNKITKILLIIGGALLCFGAVLCTLSAALGFRGDFGVTAKGHYVSFAERGGENSRLTRTQLEPFTEIDISAIAGDIELVPSDSYFIEYSTDGTAEVKWSVENGTLKAEGKTPDGGEFYLMRFGRYPWDFNIGTGSSLDSTHVKIGYPADALFGTVSLESIYGDIWASGLNCSSLDITAECGDINLSSTAAEQSSIKNDLGNVDINGLTGVSCKVALSMGDADFNSIRLTGEQLTGRLDVTNNLGDIDAENVQADGIYFINDCGDVSLEHFYVTRVIDIQLELGDAELSDASGGRYNFDLETDLGSVEVAEVDYGSRALISNGAAATIKVHNSMGDIEFEY